MNSVLAISLTIIFYLIQHSYHEFCSCYFSLINISSTIFISLLSTLISFTIVFLYFNFLFVCIIIKNHFVWPVCIFSPSFLLSMFNTVKCILLHQLFLKSLLHRLQTLNDSVFAIDLNTFLAAFKSSKDNS